MSRPVCVSCVSVAHREITKARKAVFKGDSSHHTKHIFHVAFSNGLYVKIFWSILVEDCVLLIGKGKVIFVYISYVQFCFYI